MCISVMFFLQYFWEKKRANIYIMPLFIYKSTWPSLKSVWLRIGMLQTAGDRVLLSDHECFRIKLFQLRYIWLSRIWDPAYKFHLLEYPLELEGSRMKSYFIKMIYSSPIPCLVALPSPISSVNSFPRITNSLNKYEETTIKSHQQIKFQKALWPF